MGSLIRYHRLLQRLTVTIIPWFFFAWFFFTMMVFFIDPSPRDDESIRLCVFCLLLLAYIDARNRTQKEQRNRFETYLPLLDMILKITPDLLTRGASNLSNREQFLGLTYYTKDQIEHEHPKLAREIYGALHTRLEPESARTLRLTSNDKRVLILFYADFLRRINEPDLAEELEKSEPRAVKEQPRGPGE